MDKETLSNYGWIVICVLVLAVSDTAIILLLHCNLGGKT